MRMKYLVMAIVCAVCVMGWTGQAASQSATLERTMASCADSTIIPPNCTTWFLHTPFHTLTVHQDAYVDNGDGIVSLCDLVKLNGRWWHVTKAKYTDCAGVSGGPFAFVDVEFNELPASNNVGLAVLVLLLAALAGVVLLRRKTGVRAGAR